MQIRSRSLVWHTQFRPVRQILRFDRFHCLMAADRHAQTSAAQGQISTVAVAQLTSTSSAEDNLSACSKLVEVSNVVSYVLDT